VAEHTKGVLKVELLQTGFDGLSCSAAFVNACNLYTLTKHGATDEKQLVGAVECAGTPTYVPRHDAGERTGIERLRCRRDVGV
jgi:hypothetical protein